MPMPEQWACYHCTFSNISLAGSECVACGRTARAKRKRDAGADPGLVDDGSTQEPEEILMMLASMVGAEPAPQQLPPTMTRVRVKFDDGALYSGTILAHRSGSVRIAYDDGDAEWAPFPDDDISCVQGTKLEAHGRQQGRRAKCGGSSRGGDCMSDTVLAAKSKHRGVSWRKDKQKWTSQIAIDGQQRYLGLFDDEQQAARAYKDAAAGGALPSQRAKSSAHRGVSWYKDRQSWQVQYKGRNLGYFDEEAQAARAYGIVAAGGTLPPHETSSQHRGVSWSKGKQKWRATIGGTNTNRKKTKQQFLGYFDDEEAAGAAYRHAMAGGALPEKIAVSSQYPGVSWAKDRHKWRANITVGGKQHGLGHFDDEQLAAQAYKEAVAASLGGGSVGCG